MKKPTLKKRSKGHISMMAPPECANLNNSKLSDSPRCSTRLENSETCSMKFRKWERRRIFMAVLKILFVVVVALVTKRMALAVIMSAFSLFFLEYVVKYVYGLFINIFVSRTASVGSIEGDTSEGDGVISDCSSLNASSEETQDAQTESDLDGRVSQDNNKMSGFEDIGLSETSFENDQNYDEGSNSKRRGSRRAKVKSKMKKLVPKKIRKSIKRRTGSKREELNLMEEDNYEVKEYDTEVDDDKEDIGVSASDSCEHDSDESVVETKPQRPMGRRISILSYWFLFFVVLVGLVAGRSLAVVLTVAWCLIMKLVDCVRKRRKLP